MTSKDFRSINFGFASAEIEVARSPVLLLDGYFDLNHVCAQALESDRFLILGYKGSGKSAVGERLKLLYQADSQVFITLINLEDFPYAKLSHVVQDNIAPEARYPTAWSWVLLIQLFASFEKDQGLLPADLGQYRETLKALRDMGLLPMSGLSNLIRSTTKQSFKLSVPKFFEGKWDTEHSPADIPHYVDNLKRLVADLRTDSKHVLIIDGLDEIVTNESAQWDSLGALIFEANRLNALFQKNAVSAKIIVLCRTDIFEVLKGANKNKIRQDSAIELNWYADPKAPAQSLLVRIANLRAALAFGKPTDVFAEFFPKKLFNRSTPKVLLDTTRHTPRDFLQMLKYIQVSCKDQVLTADDVKSGLRQYSLEYFLPEIVDELEGYATASQVKLLFQAIGSLRSRDFSLKQVHEVLDSSRSDLTRDHVDTMLQALFECSAVGNIQKRDSNERFLTFRFRNRHATFNPSERMLLHRGLWRALNLPVDPTWENELPSAEGDAISH